MSVEGPGGLAGPLTRPEPGEDAPKLPGSVRRRTWRAVALAVIVVLGVLGGAALAAWRNGRSDNGWLAWFFLTLPLAIVAIMYGRRAEAKVVDVDGPVRDENRARLARRIALAAVVLATMLSLGLVIWASWNGLIDVGNTFFSWEHLSNSFPEVFDGFKLNIAIFIVAEILVLAWGLLVAIVRQLPGRSAAPLRWLATIYVDLFRGLPAIVTIYLVVFGLPLTQLPIISDTADIDFKFLGLQIDQVVVLGIFALVLVYGAYVAEVYRAGIESVHWSQRRGAGPRALPGAVDAPRRGAASDPARDPAADERLHRAAEGHGAAQRRRGPRGLQPGSHLCGQQLQPVVGDGPRALLPRDHDPDDPLHRLRGQARPASACRRVQHERLHDAIDSDAGDRSTSGRDPRIGEALWPDHRAERRRPRRRRARGRVPDRCVGVGQVHAAALRERARAVQQRDGCRRRPQR